MPEPLLQTKLYIPPIRPNLVPRPHLIERLNQGLYQGNKLTLISAPAGFGKTTLVSEWIAGNKRPAAWLSLDERDNDPTRFLTYIVSALQKVDSNIGKGVLGMLQSPQPPPTESILTILLNEIATILENFILVLDDYHLIDAKSVDASTSVDEALTFLLEHLPPQMQLVIATREDPNLPLARLRARGQLTELRAIDLRFTSTEAGAFLNQIMGLDLSTEQIAALEMRAEGWIAGLQLAALALQGTISVPGHKDTAELIDSFTGSHRFVLDYLVEEVLEQQSERVQTFLLKTAVLDRMTGSLCDALSGQEDGQRTLEYLEHANLFVVPLDSERLWYRYHHLFVELLRRRLHQFTASSQEGDWQGVAEYHIRASEWFEENDLEIEAFLHAAAANDVERAERLIEGEGMPLQLRGAAAPVLNWLKSLPKASMDARPSLWVAYGSALVFAGQSPRAESKLLAAEAALRDAELDNKTQDLIGQIAALRALMAISQYHVETIIVQSRRALEYLNPDNLPLRTLATWTLGFAYQLQGDHAAASRAYAEVISNSQASGNLMLTLAATTSLGLIQEAENELYLAAETYRHAQLLAGDHPFNSGIYVGLARVLYEWNDLDAAQQLGEQSAQLAAQIEGIDTPADCAVLLARVKLAQGDVAGAAEILTTADQFVRQQNFKRQMPKVATAQVITFLRQGNLPAAAHLAKKHELPISQARVHLAQGETFAALAVLDPLRRQVEPKGLDDERLKVIVLQAVAQHAHGEKEKALQLLADALALAEPGGFVRIFVDEGPMMARLLREALGRGITPVYVGRLLAAFSPDEPVQVDTTSQANQSSLVEPLSERELEVLQLIAEGLTNRQIADRLYLSINTVKAHARNIYSKMGVNNRTQAVAKARVLGVLPRY